MIIASSFPLRLRFTARAAAIACVPVLIVLSLLPSGEMVRTGMPKIVEHFVAYGGAAGLAALGWSAGRGDRTRIVIGLVALAGVLEYSQRWSSGREPGLDTFFASAFGVCAGVAAGGWALSLLLRHTRGA